jgi:hypothetical protein
VFIVGCARSGTTWVRSILSQHPAVVGGAESHLFPVLYDPLTAPNSVASRRERVLAAYDRRTEQAGMFGNTGPHRWIDRPALERLLSQAEAKNLAGETAARDVIDGILGDYFKRHRGATGAALVEKTPRHLIYADLILDWWREARILEVVRDGRDVCVSLAHKSKRFAWAPSDRRAQIERWAGAIRHGIEARSTPPAQGRWSVVRYEDLSDDPTREIRRIFEFAQLAADEPFVARVAEATAFSNAKRPGDSHHVRRGEVGGWRDEFTESDRKEFQELAGDLLVTLGYAD